MDVEAMRTFVTVAETGQFQAAADELGISQQAVSKRIATLEKHLGVTLLVRTSRGSRMSLDGQVFLPHAKKVLTTVEQAEQAVRPGSRPLRVDVLNRRIAPAQAVYRFYRSQPEMNLDAVTLSKENAAQAARAVLDGTVDASFRALPAGQVPAGIRAERLLDAPLELLVGPSHPLADVPWVRPADLAGHRIWIPGIRPGTEWAAFYQALSEAFGLSIDALGPNFGDEALMDALADSDALATLVGSGDRYVWPQTHDLRRIPLREPTPVYTHVLLSRTGDQHPVLTALRDHLRTLRLRTPDDVWARTGQTADRDIPAGVALAQVVVVPHPPARRLTPARRGLPRDWTQVTLTKPSTDERLDAALALDAAHAVSPDQRLLRVLLADDQVAFERALDERLAQHRAGVGENPAPGTLLPLGAIALAALAVQVHGWDLQTRSAYLPASLLKPPAAIGS